MSWKMFVSFIKVSFPVRTEKWETSGEEKEKLKRSLTMRAKAAIGVGSLLTVLVTTVILVCVLMPEGTKAFWFPCYHSDSKLGVYKNAAVSTDAAPCAPIGKEILEKNGSAVDAAIAVLLCMGVVNPQSMGLGGGFLMLFYKKNIGKTFYFDAREVAPLKATVDMFDGNASLSSRGPLSIAVPGELLGFDVAHKNHGNLPWEELFKPTIKLCIEGIPVSKHLAKALKVQEDEIKANELFRRVFVNNATGQIFKEGENFTRYDLAATFEIIAKLKSDALYGDNEFANRFLKDLADMGSIITKDDMMSYQVLTKDPVTMKVKNNLTLVSTSTPGSGGLLAFALSILDKYGLDCKVAQSEKESVLTIHRITEILKFTFARRLEMEDDSSAEEFVKNITSPSYIEAIWKQIDDSKTYDDPAHYGVDMGPGSEDHGTAHMAVVAPNGDAVTVTSTINQYFGSMLMSPSTGIILNDEMDDFSSPNITNYFGLPPMKKNHVHPRKSPMSSMCPAIVLDDKGDVKLAIGGNGGTKILTSVAIVTFRNIWLGEDIKQSIDGPRWHHQLLPNNLVYEENFPEDLLSELRKLGHNTTALHNEMSGIIVGISRGDDGKLYANSDYRKGGTVDGF